MASKILSSLFDQKNIPSDAKKILEDFDEIAQSAFPANARQRAALPKQIRELSRQMTDERGSRRVGYMNDKIFLASYVRYFMWWNLVRLSRLFANLDFSFLNEGGECLDIGSGPLTVPCALWLSRPELRQKKIVWNVMDISQGALLVGEEIFLSIAARTGGEPWKIVRAKGALGSAAKQKARFVSCANTFNEILQTQTEPPDFLAKKYSQALFNYIDFSDKGRAAILLVEPGVPKFARFVSLMRGAFIRRGFSITAPCPHQAECPMDGRRAGQNGANGKWCNFAFETDGAPKKLLALSERAGIPKERAVLSFALAAFGGTEAPAGEESGTARAVAAESFAGQNGTAKTRGLASQRSGRVFGQEEIFGNAKNGGRNFGRESSARGMGAGQKSAAPRGMRLRIASDVIRIPAAEDGGKVRVGHYACSQKGLVLALSSGGPRVYSGDLLEADGAGGGRESRDKKSGALVVEI